MKKQFRLSAFILALFGAIILYLFIDCRPISYHTDELGNFSQSYFFEGTPAESVKSVVLVRYEYQSYDPRIEFPVYFAEADFEFSELDYEIEKNKLSANDAETIPIDELHICYISQASWDSICKKTDGKVYDGIMHDIQIAVVNDANLTITYSAFHVQESHFDTIDQYLYRKLNEIGIDSIRNKSR